MTRAAAALGLSMLLSCSAHGRPPEGIATGARRGETATPTAFLLGAVRPSPLGTGELVVTDASRQRFAVYDSALVVLVLLRSGQRSRAGSILRGLAALQGSDGSLPFSFVGREVDAARGYVRAGAVAWIGYAAVEYVNAEPGGDAREDALRLAHRAAAYLLSRQVNDPADARDGLVRGGAGVLAYEAVGDDVKEILRPGAIPWVSTEHNVDAFFFLRALARVSGTPAYTLGAARVAAGLRRAWRDDVGQLARGIGPGGEKDPVRALDCASWGAVFLDATSDRARAEASFATSDDAYAAKDARTGVRGHRAQADGPVLEDALLMSRFASKLPARTWDHLDAVWPEGGAGVALAAWRLGHRARAKEILAALEPLRAPSGALPTFTVEVPFVFDTGPSVAGTAWVELVRFELGRAPEQPTLWAP